MSINDFQVGGGGIFTLAYGEHVVGGILAQHKVDLIGTSKKVTIKVLLGLGEWDGLRLMTYEGSIIDPVKYTFHPGTLSTGPTDPIQGIDPRFPASICHNRIAYYTAELPTGMADEDRPDKMKVIARCLKVNDYDASGNVIGFSYSANPARVFVDLVRRSFNKMRLSNSYFISRIDWAAFVAARDWYNVNLPVGSTEKAPKNFKASSGSGGSLSPGTYTVSAVIGDGSGWSLRTLEVPLTVPSSGRITASMDQPEAAWGVTSYRWYVKFGGVYYMTTTATPSLNLTALGSAQTLDVNASGSFLVNRPRLESHIAFTGQVLLVDALNSVMYTACSDWQDVDGKLRIVTPQARTPIGTLTVDNTLPDSFVLTRRDSRTKTNRMEGTYRDLLDPNLAEAQPLPVDRPESQSEVGPVVETVQLGSMTQNQAARVLNHQIRGRHDLDRKVESGVDGSLADAMPGDVLTVIDVHKGMPAPGVPFMLIDAQDDDSTTADTRSFSLLEYAETYSDTDTGPITTISPTEIPGRFGPPYPVASVSLVQTTETLPEGTVTLNVTGSVQFSAFQMGQVGRVYIKKGSGSYAYFTAITPTPETGVAGFIVRGLDASPYTFKVVVESVLGVVQTAAVTEYPITVAPKTTAPSVPTGLAFQLDGNRVKGSWNKNTESDIAGYNVYDGSDVLLEFVRENFRWTFPQSSAITWKVSAVNTSGVESAKSAPVTFGVPAPSGPTGYGISFDGTRLTHKLTAVEGVTYDFATANNGTGILSSNDSDGVFEELNPSTASRSITRYARAIRFGVASAWVSTSVTVSAPLAPTVSIDMSFPSSKVLRIVGSTPAAQVKQTRVQISTVTGAGFDAAIVSTLRFDGKQEAVTIDGSVSQNVTLYVKVYYADAFTDNLNDQNRSAELACGFTQFTGSDLANGIITEVKLATDAVTASKIAAGAINTAKFANTIEPVTLNPGPPTPLTTYLGTKNVFDTVNGKLYRWSGTTYIKEVQAGDIAAGAVTAGTIAAGAVSASEISAGAIRANHAAIGTFGPNLILNPSFEAGGSDGWTNYSVSFPMGTVTQLIDAPNGDFVIRLSNNQSVLSKAIPVVPGKKYVVRCRLRHNNGTGTYQFAAIERADKPISGFVDASNDDSQHNFISANNSTITTWTSEASHTFIYTAPTGIYWTSFAIFNLSSSGTLDADDFEVNQVIGGAYIADAAIGSAHIIDAAILTAKINDLAVTSAKIADLAVGTAKIADAAITNAKIGNLAVDSAKIANAAINMLKVADLTSSNFVDGISGVRINPTGPVQLNDGVTIKDSIPLNEIGLRSINSIDQNGRWRGNDTGRVPVSVITSPALTKTRIWDDNVSDIVVTSDITGYHIDDAANSDSVARANVIVLNKFGEVVKQLPDVGYFGSGVVGVGEYDRKYADPAEEAIFKITIWNRAGYSDPVYLNLGSRSTSLPTVKLRANCPLELVATPVDANSISLSWQFGSSVTVYRRQRGTSTWTTHASGVSSASPYSVTGLAERTWYEFKVSAGSGNDSNIALVQTKQVGSAAPSFPSPSGLTGSPDGSSPTTQINLSWARNATNNDNVEIYKDGSLLTTLAGTATSYSATSLTAGTAYTFKVRNKWTSGPTFSEYSNEVTVSTQASGGSASAPSGLSANNNSVGASYSVGLNWTNNGAAGTISIERKLGSGGTWSTINSGLASSTVNYDDNTVTPGTSGRTYFYRVKNSAVTEYSNETLVFVEPYAGDDPYCVTFDTLVLVSDPETGARSWLPIGEIEVGMLVITVNTLTGRTNRAYVQGIRDGMTDVLFRTHSISGELVQSSDSHPFVEIGSRDGRAVSTLSEGANLLRVATDDNFAEETFVDHIDVEELAEPVPVRTLALGVLNHTFVTGSNGTSGLVSHNIKPF